MGNSTAIFSNNNSHISYSHTTLAIMQFTIMHKLCQTLSDTSYTYFNFFCIHLRIKQHEHVNTNLQILQP